MQGATDCSLGRGWKGAWNRSMRASWWQQRGWLCGGQGHRQHVELPALLCARWPAHACAPSSALSPCQPCTPSAMLTPPSVHPRWPPLPRFPHVRGVTVLEAAAPLAVACSMLQIHPSPQPAFISGCDVPPPPHPICTVPLRPCTPSCISCLAQPCSGVPGAHRGSMHHDGTVGTSSSPLVSPHRGGSLPSCLAPDVSQGGPRLA